MAVIPKWLCNTFVKLLELKLKVCKMDGFHFNFFIMGVHRETNHALLSKYLWTQSCIWLYLVFNFKWYQETKGPHPMLKNISEATFQRA